MPEESATDAPPEPSEEAPDETPDETAEAKPPVPGDSPGEVRARREARNLREQIKELRANQESAVSEALSSKDEEIAGLESKLLEARAQLAAVGKLRNPEDVTRFVDVHSVGLDRLEAEIAKVVKERPYLSATAASAGQLPQGTQNGDEARPTQDASAWLREHLQRR